MLDILNSILFIHFGGVVPLQLPQFVSMFFSTLFTKYQLITCAYIPNDFESFYFLVGVGSIHAHTNTNIQLSCVMLSAAQLSSVRLNSIQLKRKYHFTLTSVHKLYKSVRGVQGKILGK